MASPASWKTSQSKLLALQALVATTIVSCTMVALSIRQASSTRYLADVQRNRATIQIIVHIISVNLGALQTYVISSLIRFRTNTRLCAKPTSLGRLKLHNALNFGSLDFDLPLRSAVVVLAYVAAIQVPSAIWAGAITSVIISTNSTATYRIPLYNASTIDNWSTTCLPADACNSVTTITTE
jgi:hypothetical protein